VSVMLAAATEGVLMSEYEKQEEQKINLLLL
jgi:hypothetical protein